MKVEEQPMSEWLIGKSKHSIDDKNRVFIPSKFRDKLGDSVIVTKSLTGRCLRIYSKSGFDLFLQDTVKKLPKISAGEMISWIGSNSEELLVDGQGRIALPPEYKDFAGLKKNVVSSGAFEYVEMWDEELFEAKDSSMDIDAIRQMLQSREDL
jgi:MraZ protein